jgi:hypothetical protein
VIASAKGLREEGIEVIKRDVPASVAFGQQLRHSTLVIREERNRHGRFRDFSRRRCRACDMPRSRNELRALPKQSLPLGRVRLPVVPLGIYDRLPRLPQNQQSKLQLPEAITPLEPAI